MVMVKRVENARKGRNVMSKTIGVPLDRVLMDGIEEMVYVMGVSDNVDFYYDFINQAAMKGIGITEEAIGKSLHEVLSQEKAYYLSKQYKKAITDRKSFVYEDSFFSPSGKMYYSKTKLTPLFDEYNRCTHIVALVLDVTEQIEAELHVSEYLNKLNESEQRFRSLFHYNLNAIFSLDLTGRILNGNMAVENVTGYAVQDLVGIELTELVTPEDVSLTKKCFQQALYGTIETYRMAIINKKGERVEISMKFTPIIIDHKVTGIYGVLNDVTKYTQLLSELRHNEKRFRFIAEHAHDLITVLDEKGEIIYASPSHEKILGYEDSDYVGKLFFHHIHPAEVNLMEDVFSQSLINKQPCELRYRQKHKTKEWIWTELHGTPVFDEYGRFAHMVIISRDISLHKEYESKLEFFATHDPLTTLPNRRLFKEKLAKALFHLQEKQAGLAVIMMDIDYFKNINDQFGHDIGDEVIVEFGKRIKNHVREQDIVARLGGDEFIAFFPNVQSTEQVISIAEEIQQAVQEPWHVGGHTLKVTASVGIAMAPLQGATVPSLIKNADEVLYEAKRAGKNTYKLRVM